MTKRRIVTKKSIQQMVKDIGAEKTLDYFIEDNFDHWSIPGVEWLLIQRRRELHPIG